MFAQPTTIDSNLGDDDDSHQRDRSASVISCPILKSTDDRKQTLSSSASSVPSYRQLVVVIPGFWKTV
jgi:hypothetical protein